MRFIWLRVTRYRRRYQGLLEYFCNVLSDLAIRCPALCSCDGLKETQPHVTGTFMDTRVSCFEFAQRWCVGTKDQINLPTGYGGI
jgi:hypothetical protein